jgi:hypothetical protein|tara:strand:- start:151 stop:474 length:324 start_codon:yes stop_codon:yes gene_type:complete
MIWKAGLVFVLLLFSVYLYNFGVTHQQVSFSPDLIEKNYKGFNIFEFLGVFYALNPKEDPEIIKEIHTGAKFLWASYHSEGGLRKKIDKYVREGRKPLKFPIELPGL